MVLEEEQDKVGLLHPTSPTLPTTPRTPARYDETAGYELRDIEFQDVEASDLGVRWGDSASTLQPAPSIDDRNSDQNDKDVEAFDPFVRQKPTRSSTFATISSRTKPAVKRSFYGFLSYILRSGRYASHVSYEHANPSPPGKASKYSGWRGGVYMAAASAGAIFCINLVFTIWAGVTSGSGTNVGTLYKGECSTVHKMDSWIHIGINIMGTLLLGASNYTMQCLGSPTRKEVDIAHRLGKYKDIGLPSLRNLVGWQRRIVFVLLLLSTLPLHFLWNSAVFTTTQRLDYNVYVVTPDFLTQPAVDCTQNVTTSFSSLEDTTQTQDATAYNTLIPMETKFTDKNNVTYTIYTGDEWAYADICNASRALLTNSTRNLLTRLDNEACIKAYGPGNTLMSGFANVLAVTKEQPSETNGTVLMALRYENFVSNYTGNRWICDSEYLVANKYKCNYKNVAENATSWSLGPLTATEENPYRLVSSPGWDIDYCLAEPTELTGMCQLQYSLIIMICVLIANATKFICIMFILRTHLDQVLATIGDAIASFLESPDPITAGRPFLTRSQARNFKLNTDEKAMRYYPATKPIRWYQAPSWVRWIITLVLCITAIIIVGNLLTYGNTAFMGHAQGAYDSPYAAGFGTYSEFATVNIFGGSDSTTGMSEDIDFDSNSLLLAMVALANLPQVIVSCLYFAYNTIYTSMVSADEWSRFAAHRKGLRTTDPKGEQRSTYWLSLPWTYALPLAIASSVLHWLISQSLFVARTEILNSRGEPEPISYMNVGYNPLAILLALLFGCLMVLAMVANGWKKITEGSVLVGNNSLAIAAACQRGKDEGAEKKRVMWGAVSHEEDGRPGHCCFSSEEVEKPRAGGLYL